MSVKDGTIQENTRYKLAPHVTIGSLQGSLIGFKAQSLTKIEGEGIVNFIQNIGKYLVRDNGVSIKELKELFYADSDQLKNVFEFLVKNSICIKSDSDFNLTAFLAYERAGGQVSMETILHRIEESVIEIITHDNNPITNELKIQLEESGLNVAPTGETSQTPTLRVAMANSHLDPLLEDVNNKSLEDHIPWISLVPYDGQSSWVGPFFIPHQSACLNCYNLRKSANFSDDVFRSELMKIQPINPESQPVHNQPINTVQVGIANNLITEWITLRDYAPSAVPGGFTTINLDDKGVSFNNHRIYRVPRCPKCSPAADTGFPQVWYHEVNK